MESPQVAMAEMLLKTAGPMGMCELTLMTTPPKTARPAMSPVMVTASSTWLLEMERL